MKWDNFPAERCAHPLVRLTQSVFFFQTNAIDVLDWPPVSTDLNPITHLLDQLEKRVRSLHPQPKDPHEFGRIL